MITSAQYNSTQLTYAYSANSILCATADYRAALVEFTFAVLDLCALALGIKLAILGASLERIDVSIREGE